MIETAILTKRESQIAELFAWGASKKDIAQRLFLSERTIENHARNIYEKTGCQKVNELAAWWFCKTFHISFDLSPLKQKMVALMFLAILIPQAFAMDQEYCRTMRTPRTTRTIRARRARRENESGINYF